MEITYKDVHDISSFFVRIQIKNLTMKDYSLKDFYIIYNGEKNYFNHSNIVFTSNHSSIFSFFIDFGEITNQDSFFVIEIQQCCYGIMFFFLFFLSIFLIL